MEGNDVANGYPSNSNRPVPGAGGTRFRTSGTPAARPATQGGTRFRSQAAPSSGAPSGVRPAASAYSRSRQPQRRANPAVVIGSIAGTIAVVAALLVFALPALTSMLSAEPEPAVEAGVPVTINIPAGSGGDAIASILSEAHIIENPKEYYAAVTKLGAEMSIKPGDYEFTTLQDPEEVVAQLVAGPNIEGMKLTVPEGLTVAQVAARVEEAYGIPAADFVAQAKASAYVADYPFLEEAANDSLEGFLCPKTYSFTSEPTADDVIRVMLDQYELDYASLDFAAARETIKARYGLDMTDYDLLNMAAVVEREGLNGAQRAHVASVFFNRLAGKGEFAGRPYLESDATLMYETGGAVTADDIATSQSPYNSYKNAGLPPTPICSPSLESLEATLNPLDSEDLYFFITKDGEWFSETFDQHRAAIAESR